MEINKTFKNFLFPIFLNIPCLKNRGDYKVIIISLETNNDTLLFDNISKSQNLLIFELGFAKILVYYGFFLFYLGKYIFDLIFLFNYFF